MGNAPVGQFGTFRAVFGEVSFILFTTFVFLIFAQLCSEVKRLGRKWRKQRLENGRGESVAGFEAIPGPTPLRFDIFNVVGNIHQMWPLTKTMVAHTEWRDEFGEIYRLFGSFRFGVMMNSPELVQTILKSRNFDHTEKSPLAYSLMKPFITNGLLVSNGHLWQSERKILLRSFTIQNLRAYTTLLNTHSQRFVNSLEKLFSDGKVHTICDLINTSFLDVICEMITGFDIYNTTEGLEYHHNFEIWKSSIAYRMLYPWFHPNFFWRLSPFSRQVDRAVKSLMDFARNKIVEHRKIRSGMKEKNKQQDSNNNNNNTTTEPTLLDSNETNDSSEPQPFRSVLDELVEADLSDDQIIDEVNTLLFGGHDTGAAVIHFFCFLMALNPDTQERCQKEVDDIFEDPILVQKGQMTSDSLNNLKYLERCLLETLRLYPPVAVFIRELTAPLRIEYRGKPVELPTGAQVTVCPYTLHRNPLYFPNPEKFDPDRFLPEECAKRHTYAYIPFSSGPRNCLGIKFAMMEIKIISSYLLRNFEIYTTDKLQDITIMPNLTLMPHRDMNFIFKKRKTTKH